jgi:hypothetical protein
MRTICQHPGEAAQDWRGDRAHPAADADEASADLAQPEEDRFDTMAEYADWSLHDEEGSLQGGAQTLHAPPDGAGEEMR